MTLYRINDLPPVRRVYGVQYEQREPGQHPCVHCFAWGLDEDTAGHAKHGALYVDEPRKGEYTVVCRACLISGTAQGHKFLEVDKW